MKTKEIKNPDKKVGILQYDIYKTFREFNKMYKNKLFDRYDSNCSVMDKIMPMGWLNCYSISSGDGITSAPYKMTYYLILHLPIQDFIHTSAIIPVSDFWPAAFSRKENPGSEIPCIFYCVNSAVISWRRCIHGQGPWQVSVEQVQVVRMRLVRCLVNRCRACVGVWWAGAGHV